MSGTKSSADKAGQQAVRHFQVAPVARAVRLALAATTLALVGTGAAHAGTCSTAGSTTQCTGDFTDTLSFPDAVDLTLVVGDGVTPANVTPGTGADGIDVSGDGALDVTSYASILTHGADGIHAYSTGSVSVTNNGYVQTYVDGVGQEGIDASANGDVHVINNSQVVAYAYGAYDVTAVSAETAGCDCTVTVDNSADGLILAHSTDGNAIGIYAYAATGHVVVDNAGSIDGYSANGLADGVFAAGGSVDVHNADGGTINAYGSTWAAGIEAEGSDLTTVQNDGQVGAFAYGYLGQAFGIYAVGGDGGATVDNTGAIDVVGFYGTGIDASASGNVAVTNTGDITIADSLIGTGIHAASNGEGSAVTVGNDGDMEVHSYYGSTGIEVVATGQGASGSATNAGSIYAVQTSKYGSSSGIVVSADGDAHIDNSGSISVLQYGGGTLLPTSHFTPYYGGSVYGAMALAFNGDATVANSGTIDVNAMPFGYAAGIVAASQNGSASVDNSGLVHSQAKYAYGIVASSGGGDVAIHNDAGGTAYATSLVGLPYSFASSLAGIATGGDVTIDNAGDAYAIAYGVAIGSLGLSGQGNVSETNSGQIAAYAYQGTAIGVFGRADYGTASLDNAGGVYAASYYGDAAGLVARGGTAAAINSGSIQAYGYSSAYGIEALGTDLASITNDGDITAYATYGTAIGALGVSSADDVTIGGTGSITVYGAQAAIGLYGYAAAGSVTIDSSNAIQAYSWYGIADGIFAAGADVDASNAGDVAAEAYGFAAGIEAHGDTVSVSNSGSLQAASHTRYSFGIYAHGDTSVEVSNSGSIAVSGPYAFGIFASGGDVTVDNSGDITTGERGADRVTGILAYAPDASATVSNSGNVSVIGARYAVGLAAYSAESLHISNTGTISAATDSGDGRAIGVVATAYGLVQLDNAGTISASHPDYAVAVALNSATGSVLTNTGTIRTDAPIEGQVAVHGGDWIEQVLNYGQLDGALVLNGGDDLLFNGAGGVWNVGNHTTDFGIGDDTLVNGAGGLVELTNATMAFGDGDDAIVNAAGGTLQLQGGTITLGSSTSAGDSFINDGTLRALGTGNMIDMGTGASTALVPSLNPLPLVNGGVIDFVDGAPDDALTITGDLDGQGHIHVDLRPLTNTSDLLYVDGSIVDGAVQTVDVDLGGKPTSAMLNGTATFAHVTGNSAAGAFVGGRVLGYDPGNFLDLQVQVTSQIDASGAASDLFSVGVQTAGLSNAGSVAAALAPGAQSMVNSLIGTWRQRTGVQVDRGTIGLSPWLRMFSDRGDIRADQVTSSFGQGGTFGFDQANSGWELGLDARPWNAIHLGLLLGESDGNQRLAGTGSGDIGGQTFGVYGTWTGATGYYVDASFRWTGLTARVRADGTQQYTDGEADSFNVEAGFGAWSLPGDVLLQPQAQYTRTKLDLHPLVAGMTTFDAQSATSSRGRVGVLLSKTVDAGGWAWMPYGSVSAVREFDGEYDYAINDVFTGTTSTKGTSALVELGLGMHKGKVTVTGGLNWSDGGALDSFFGGQLVLRTTW